jgi:TP901 family phage tail tape measure protein
VSNEVILRFLADTKQLDAAYSRVAGKTTALNKTLNSVAGFGAAATKAGRSLTHGVTLPIIAAGTAAGVLGYKWDQTWTRINALTNLSTTEINKAKDAVLRLSKYGPAPQALADGFYFLASAGLDTKRTMDALDASAKGAAAGLGDFAQLAQTVSSALIVWQDKGMTAAHAVDLIVAAAKAGKMEPDKLASNLGKVAGAAAAAGISMEETAGAMAAMTNRGMAVETSAASLGQVIKNIVSPSKQAQGQAEKLGLSYSVLQKTLRNEGLIAALQMMQDKTKGNQAAIAQLFNKNVQAKRGYDGLMLTLGDTKDVMIQMTHAQGSLNSALQETDVSSSHKLAAAWSRVLAVGTKFGEALLPKLAAVGDKVAVLADRVGKLTPEQQQMAMRFALTAAAIGPLLYSVGKLSSGFALVGKNWKGAALMVLVGYLVKLYNTNEDFRQSVNDLGGKLADLAGWLNKHRDLVMGVVGAVTTYIAVTKTITAVQAAWTATTVASNLALTLGSRALAVYRMGVAVAAMEGKSFVVAQGMMSVAQWALNAAFWACPVTWVVAGLALLVGGFIYAWKHSEKFRNVMKDTWVVIQRGAGEMVRFLLPQMKFMADLMLLQFEVILKGAAKLFGWVPGIGPKLEEAAAGFDGFRESVNGVFEDIAASAEGWGRDVNYEYVNGIRTADPALIAAAASSAQAVKDAYKDPDKYFREAGKQNVSAYAQGMRDNAKKAADTAARVSAEAEQAAKVRASQFRSSVGQFASGQFAAGMGDGAPAARAAGATVGAAAKNGLEANTSWGGLGRDAGEGFAQGVASKYQRAAEAAANLAAAAMEGIRKKQNSNSPSKETMKLGKDAADGYRLGFSASQAGVTTAASATTQKLLSELSKAKAKVKSEAKDVYDAAHPGKDRKGRALKVDPTVLRHQKEQYAAALKNQRDLEKKLAAARAEDRELYNRRKANLPELGRAEQFMAPWKQLTSNAQGPVEKAARAMADSIQRHFADKKGVLPAAVAAMKSQLLQLAKDAAELHQNVFDNLSGGASLTSAFSGQGATAADMRVFLARKVADMVALGKGLSVLASKGTPTSLLKQFAMAGTDALPLVQSLVAANSTDFAAIVSSQKRIDSLANSTASQVESAVYGPRVAAPATASKSVNVSGPVTIQLVQQPGQDAGALAQDLYKQLAGMGG